MEMTNMKITSMENVNSEKEHSWKWTNMKNDNSEKGHLINGNYEKERSEKGSI